MCRDVEILGGTWYVEPTVWHYIPGLELVFPERPGDWRSMGRPFHPDGRRGYDEAACVRLSGSEDARQVYHVLASAIQDAELYFSLCPTPVWIRALYWLTMKLSKSPTAADTLSVASSST